MAIEGVEEWGKKKEHLHDSPDFHLDPNKATDPVEKLVEREGLIDALKELVGKLESTNDAEIIRQIKFVVNRLSNKTQH